MVELARLAGAHAITKQEAVIIYIFAGGLILPQIFVTLVFNSWFRESSVALAFGLGGDVAPPWFSPLPETGVFEMRTFFHSAWMMPLLVSLAGATANLLGSISLGIFFKDMFLEVERLPFPVQAMEVEGISVLTERHAEKVQALSIAAIFGFIWGFFVYTMRFISTSFKITLPLVPIPWIDFNKLIELVFPGASFGISTDIQSFTFGFILPLYIGVGTFIGSFIVYFLGNWMSVSYNLYLSPWWSPGMDIALSLQRSIMFLWAGPLIGIAIAVGLMPLLLNPRNLISLIRSKRKMRHISFVWLLVYLATASVSTALIYILAPDFPIWVSAVMNFLMPIIVTLVGTRILGITGQWFDPATSYLNELAVYSSGYSGINAWFTLWNFSWASYMNGAGWIARFFICDRTKTSISSAIKAFLLIIPLTYLVSFAFTQLFWSVSKIPSELFPGAQIFWPITATYRGYWASRPEGMFSPLLIVGGFVVAALGSAIPLVLKFVPVGLPLAIASGALMNIPWSTGILIGNLIALVTRKIIGSARFNEYKLIISAGLVMGQGVAVVIGICIALVIGSMWSMPY
jgi:hypothetical protein